MAIHFDVSNTLLLDFDVMSNSTSSYASVVNLAEGEEKKGFGQNHFEEDQWVYIIVGEGEIEIGGASYLLFHQRVDFIEYKEDYIIVNTGKDTLRAIKICTARGDLPEVIEAF